MDNEEKCCGNCTHYGSGCMNEPCHSCLGYSNWESN